jgi:dTDP-4-amino-4,6-dideoxygalactose transaminase
MLVTNNRELAEEARLYSYYGSGPGKTNFVTWAGTDAARNSAILGIYQMNHVEEFIAMRNDLANIYNHATEQSSL